MQKINLHSPLNSLGYGRVGQELTRELSEVCDVSLFPIGQVDVEPKKEIVEPIQKAIRNSRTNFDFYAPSIKIWHQNDMALFPGKHTRIGFPIFELNTFTEQEKLHLNSLDKVLVCSGWAKRVVAENTSIDYKNIHVVPLGVRNPGFVKQNENSSTNFFTCGKWEIRKGHDKIIEAFCNAFDEDDDVYLHMVCDNPFLNEEATNQWKSLYSESKMGHRIRFVDRFDKHYDLLNFMSQMDCGVFISRAEGWNLELLECMSCGIPVIATNYSGHTEFCNSNNSYLIDIKEKEIAYDGTWFHGQGEWASINRKEIDQITDYMVHIKETKPKNKEGIETANRFTWKNSAARILENV